MTHQARTTPLFLRLGVLLLAVLLLFGLIMPAHAAEHDGWKEDIVLTGDFTDTFTFTSNTNQIFRDDNAGPGDIWPGQINILNEASEPMEVALLTIVSKLEDLDLFNALMLDIEIGGEIIYSGGYGDTPKQITPFFVIPAGDVLTLDVTISFPAHYGNEMRGKEMDSTWTFEAQYLGNGPGPAMYPYKVEYIEKDTGDELADPKRAYAPYGEDVTEYALEIEGYKPLTEEETITIGVKDNVITFYYEKTDDGPSEPTDPGDDDPDPTPTDPGSDPTDPGKDPTDDPSKDPSDDGDGDGDDPGKDDDGKKPGSVQTGNDLRESNTTAIPYIFLAVICAAAVLVTAMRIRSAKRRTEEE